MSNYCAIADVRALGLSNTTSFPDASITTAIAQASDAIEVFCADYFIPQASMNVRSEIGGRGVAPLPFTVSNQLTSITNVIFEATTTSIAPVSYRVHSSTIHGDYDGVQFAVAGWDDTINGAEREMGGFSTLFAPGRALIVSGVFGYPSTPSRIKTICAQLAADIIGGVTDTESENMMPMRGNAAEKRGPLVYNLSRTTGSSRADRALRQFRRDLVIAAGV